MTDRNSRIAGAPISWGVCEAPGWGVQLDAGDVFAEIARAGYTAAEAGPDGYLPGDGAATRATLAEYRLALAGAFLPVALHDAAHRTRSIDLLEPVLERLAASPGAALSLAVMGCIGDFAAREVLSTGEWSSTLETLDEIAALAEERGVPCGVHAHAGTAVERAEDLDRVIDGSSIGLTVDTGHLVLGGIDPGQIVRDVPGRIVHVHLKDVDASQAEDWRSGAFSTYRAAVDSGLYTPLGKGDSGVAEAVQTLVASGYDGWFVVERDMSIAEDAHSSADARIDAAVRERKWIEQCIAATGVRAAG